MVILGDIMRKIGIFGICIFLLSLVITGCQHKTDNQFILTNEEQEWLSKHPVIYYASDPEFAPYEYIDEAGNHKGIAADYIAEIERIIGVDIVVVSAKTWTDALDMAKSDKVDFLFMSKSSERLKNFYFTEPFVFSPNMFISNKNYNTSVDLKNIEKYNIGVLKAYSNKDYLILLYPQSQIKDYETITEGLFDLSSGKIDLFLADLGQANYYINKYGLKDLLILDSLEYDFKFSFAFNHQNEILVSIFDKAINSMSEIEHENILEKWISTDYKNWINRDQIKFAYTILSISIICLFIAILIMVTLRKIVKQRTKELELLNKELEARVVQRTSELEDSINNLVDTQAKLIQSEKYASLGYVVSRVAHELNTPVGNLLMLQSYGSEKVEKISSNISLDLELNVFSDTIDIFKDIFENSIKSIEYIINILERFKRLEATLVSSYKTSLNIKDAVSLGIQLMYSKNMIPENTVIELDIDDIFIEANSLWIEELVENLVSNSIFHNKLGKTHIVIIGKLNDELELIFKDFGSGIDSSIIEHIFEPFYKSSEDSRRSGLGLSIVYNIVYNNLKGTVHVSSIPNEITEFIIRIPLNKA